MWTNSFSTQGYLFVKLVLQISMFSLPEIRLPALLTKIMSDINAGLI